MVGERLREPLVIVWICSLAKAVLDATRSVVRAEAWFAADASRGECPPTLVGQEIGELDVTYKDDSIGEQRRYAATPAIFSLPRLARHAACHGLSGTGGHLASIFRVSIFRVARRSTLFLEWC